jgi:hypothetical protein
VVFVLPLKMSVDALEPEIEMPLGLSVPIAPPSELPPALLVNDTVPLIGIVKPPVAWIAPPALARFPPVMVTFVRSRVVGEPVVLKKPKWPAPSFSVMVLIVLLALSIVRGPLNAYANDVLASDGSKRLAGPSSVKVSPGTRLAAGATVAMFAPDGIDIVTCATAGRASSSKIEQESAARPSADADADDSACRRERSILPSREPIHPERPPR